MKSRRSILLLLCFALAVPVAAASAADKPKVPKILITLTDGAMNRGKIVVPVTATYAPPRGTTTAKACKGKVAFSAPIGKKTVKKHGKKVRVTVFAKKTASIKTLASKCSATGSLSLPATLIDKTVKFTAGSKGNSAVKKFTKSSKLKVILKSTQPQPIPPDLVDGPWTITENYSGTPPRQWGFTIGADNSLSKRTARYGTINVHCPGHEDRVIQYSPTEEAPFDDVNVISANPFTATDTWTNPNDTSEHATQTFELNFSSSTAGTGTFQIKGTFRVPPAIPAAVITDLVPGCASDVIPVHLEAGAAA